MSKKQVTIEELSIEIKLLKELLEKQKNVLDDVLKCVNDTNIKIDLLEQNKFQSNETSRIVPKKLVGKGKSINRKNNKKNKIDEPDELDETKTEDDKPEDDKPEDDKLENDKLEDDKLEDDKNNDTSSMAETENTLEYEDDRKSIDSVKMPVKKSIKIVKSNTELTKNTQATKNADTTKNTQATKNNADNKSKLTGMNIINAFKMKFKEDEKYFNEWLTDTVKEELKNKSKEDWNKMLNSKKINVYYSYMKDKHLNVLENLKKSYNK